MRLFYCDHHRFPLPPGHRFPAAKYGMLRELLQATGRFVFTAASPADPRVIGLVHDAAYVDAFLTGRLSADVVRRIGFPWSEGLVLRTLCSVGCTLGAMADALDLGIGGGLAGGTHHAFRETGAGYCVFNDLAVATACLRLESYIRRVAIIDLDVHQGDGTASIFKHDPEVLTVSVHGRNNFPFRKQSSSIDIGLADNTGDDGYLSAIRSVLPRVADFRPEFVFYQSGVDGLASDRLGRLSLTHDGLRERDRLVFEFCRGASLPCAITLGGGYSDPIELSVDAHAATFLAAADVCD